MVLPRYTEQQNTRMQRDAESRALAALEDAGVSAAAGDPNTMQQLLVGSVSHKVLATQACCNEPRRPKRNQRTLHMFLAYNVRGIFQGSPDHQIYVSAQGRPARAQTALLRVWRPSEALQAVREGDLMWATRLTAFSRGGARDRCARTCSSATLVCT